MVVVVILVEGGSWGAPAPSPFPRRRSRRRRINEGKDSARVVRRCASAGTAPSWAPGRPVGAGRAAAARVRGPDRTGAQVGLGRVHPS